MDTILLSSTAEPKAEKRRRISWMRKTIPLNNSALFNKAKHSEEWHQSVEGTAGVLHPSDSKFPYTFLRNHTDAYLRKKGKISQADADIRLGILIEAHQPRDIAVAAAAHAMTANSLRALLPAELNVAQGSYWGLETWLQCLIAANDGNPASVTDLEAFWARLLLPYATHGTSAAGWYLRGVSSALEKSSIPNLGILPEFSVLLRRAITDYSVQLEGFRLRCQWAAAYEAAFWMMELKRTSPAATPPGHLLPEHIFESRFPVWRLWAEWRPDVSRITRLASIDSARLATVPDIVALEGPDVLEEGQRTLREGLIERYKSEMPWIRFQSMVIEIPDRTKDGLKVILQRLANGLDTISAGKTSDPGLDSMFRLFSTLTVNQAITNERLDIFEAAVKVTYTPENDIYNTVREIYTERDNLGGQHILALQHLIYVLDEPQAEDLRIMFLHPWLLHGVESCIRDCQAAVRTHIDGSLVWIHLASELHTFCTTVKESKLELLATSPYIKTQLEFLPPMEQMRNILDIFAVAQSQRPKPRGTTCPHQDADVNVDASPRRVSAPAYLLGDQENMRHPLEAMIEDFCILRLLEPDKIGPTIQQTMDAILHVWESTDGPNIDNDRRSLAIRVSKSTGDDHVLRFRCLEEIAEGKGLLGLPTFVEDLLAIMRQADLELEQAVIAFTKLLTDTNGKSECWKDLLYLWLEQTSGPELFQSNSLVDYSLQTMRAAEWLKFTRSLGVLFTDRYSSDSGERNLPFILQSQLMRWNTQVSRYSSTLTRLEDSLEDLDAVRCILTCSEGFWVKNLLRILESLRQSEGNLAEKLMQKIVGKLSSKSKNAWEIKECLYNLLSVTPETVHVCEQIWDAKHGFLDIPGLPVQSQVAERSISSTRSTVRKAVSVRTTASSQPVAAAKGITSTQPSLQSSPSGDPPTPKQRFHVPLSVAEVMIAGWLQDESVGGAKKAVIESLATVLDLTIYKDVIPPNKLQEVTLFWENIQNEILKEAERLLALQKALTAKDPKGTSLLLEELGIPDNSLLDTEITNLPAGVVDAVERISDDEVEITFPLTIYKELQRNAMGVPKDAGTLILRLCIDRSGGKPSSFCLHFNNDINLDTLEHTPWVCLPGSKLPQEHVCKSVETAIVWQLNRYIHPQLGSAYRGIADLHALMKKKMRNLGQSCIACGSSHNAKNANLRRSTPCQNITCMKLWYQLPLAVRVPEIRTDTFAVDMILTSVYVAAKSNKPELLPGCPISSCEAVGKILDSLPSLTVLSHAVNLSTVLRSYHKDAEMLISWACDHFRGVLATATGLCKIPNLPAGTHQFVLANASPKLESEFVSKIEARFTTKPKVLFHGTSLNRLPAILAQGLKICSGTPLQRTGAAHGKGIYLAEDPATSFTYAPSALSWRNSGLTNMHVILGCEVIGDGKNATPGIHVITDAQSVMVRYVFLIPNSAGTPTKDSIVPAMAKGMSALRTGAV